MKIIDLHNHSRFSYDGHDSVEELVKNAIEKGIDVIGITDHQFSLGGEMGEYIAEVSYVKEKYKDKIEVLLGLEIGTRPKPSDFPCSLSEKFDYCLFESLDDKRAMDIYEFLDWKRLFKCPCGFAHADIFALCERYGMDLLKVMKRDNIFWEINFSGNYNYYFDFISNKEKQEMVKKSGIKLSVGSDIHWSGELDCVRLQQTNELVRKLGNPLALGICD